MNDNPLLRRRWFLYVTEFCVGMCLMAVELGASRLLAPYFSSSQIVWTIIIGTIMVAMALGNFLGGKMADKFPSVTRLYLLLMIAAVWIALIPFLGRFVIAGITGLLALFVNHGLLIWAAFLTCLLWFCPPLMVLGMVTPSLIKYSMGNKATSGKIVGILEALNTVGSILGTFLPTFVTIPTMGTALSFLLFGGILVLVSAAFFLAFFIKPKKKDGPSEPLGPEDEGKAKKAKIGVGVATALCLVLTGGTAYLDAAQSSFDFGDNSIVYRGESVYNYLQVKETKDSYLFSTNVLFSIQSMIKKDGSLTGMYYDTCLAANYMAGGTEKGNLKVLVLGMGTGTYATLSKRYMPFEMDITGVEIDQKIIDLSRKYFALPESVPVHCDDGRSYLDHDADHYDVIMVDAYSGISIPFQMASVEFFASVRNHLKDDGIMVMNINMADEGKGSLNEALGDTVKSAFPSVYTYRENGSTNKELFAGISANIPAKLASSLPTMQDQQLRQSLAAVSAGLLPYEDTGVRMSDDNANVEMLSARAIDEIIASQVGEYRAIYKEKGFWGLLQYVLS